MYRFITYLIFVFIFTLDAFAVTRSCRVNGTVFYNVQNSTTGVWGEEYSVVINDAGDGDRDQMRTWGEASSSNAARRDARNNLVACLNTLTQDTDFPVSLAGYCKTRYNNEGENGARDVMETIEARYPEINPSLTTMMARDICDSSRAEWASNPAHTVTIRLEMDIYGRSGCSLPSTGSAVENFTRPINILERCQAHGSDPAWRTDIDNDGIPDIVDYTNDCPEGEVWRSDPAAGCVPEFSASTTKLAEIINSICAGGELSECKLNRVFDQYIHMPSLDKVHNPDMGFWAWLNAFSNTQPYITDAKCLTHSGDRDDCTNTTTSQVQEKTDFPSGYLLYDYELKDRQYMLGTINGEAAASAIDHGRVYILSNIPDDLNTGGVAVVEGPPEEEEEGEVTVTDADDDHTPQNTFIGVPFSEDCTPYIFTDTPGTYVPVNWPNLIAQDNDGLVPVEFETDCTAFLIKKENVLAISHITEFPLPYLDDPAEGDTVPADQGYYLVNQCKQILDIEAISDPDLSAEYIVSDIDSYINTQCLLDPTGTEALSNMYEALSTKNYAAWLEGLETVAHFAVQTAALGLVALGEAFVTELGLFEDSVIMENVKIAINLGNDGVRVGFYLMNIDGLVEGIELAKSCSDGTLVNEHCEIAALNQIMLSMFFLGMDGYEAVRHMSETPEGSNLIKSRSDILKPDDYPHSEELDEQYEEIKDQVEIKDCPDFVSATAHEENRTLVTTGSQLLDSIYVCINAPYAPTTEDVQFFGAIDDEGDEADQLREHFDDEDHLIPTGVINNNFYAAPIPWETFELPENVYLSTKIYDGALAHLNDMESFMGRDQDLHADGDPFTYRLARPGTKLRDAYISYYVEGVDELVHDKLSTIISTHFSGLQTPKVVEAEFQNVRLHIPRIQDLTQIFQRELPPNSFGVSKTAKLIGVSSYLRIQESVISKLAEVFQEYQDGNHGQPMSFQQFKSYMLNNPHSDEAFRLIGAIGAFKESAILFEEDYGYMQHLMNSYSFGGDSLQVEAVKTYLDYTTATLIDRYRNLFELWEDVIVNFYYENHESFYDDDPIDPQSIWADAFNDLDGNRTWYSKPDFLNAPD